MSIWKKKLSAMRHYDAVAKIYDLQYGEEQRAKIEFALKNLDLACGVFVLDVGCGTGFLFEYLLDKNRILVGIDISKNVLKRAKEKFRGRRNLFLVQADADYLPFPDGVFDVVFAVTLLQNMPSPITTLREMKRVVKSGANILVTGLKKSFRFEEFRKLFKGFLLKKIWDVPYLKDYVALLCSFCSD